MNVNTFTQRTAESKQRMSVNARLTAQKVISTLNTIGEEYKTVHTDKQTLGELCRVLQVQSKEITNSQWQLFISNNDNGAVWLEAASLFDTLSDAFNPSK